MVRAVTLTLAGVLLALTFACGGSGDATVTPTVTPDIGLGASFPRHLSGVSPENGASVTNAGLSENHPLHPAGTLGICATFSFAGGDGMGDDPTTLVKLFVGGEDVTDSAEWAVTGSQPPTGGTICYVPGQAFQPGPVLTTARWSEVSGRQFIHSWQFTVTE